MAVIQIPSLECEPGAENEFGTTDTYRLLVYTSGDWDGAAGNTVRFDSATPGSQVTFDLSVCGNVGSAAVPLEYVDFQDMKFTGGYVYANAKTCGGRVGGNNTNILWMHAAGRLFFFYDNGEKR